MTYQVYKETHGAIGTLMWYFTLTGCLIMIGILSFGAYQQLILDQPWGSEPNTDQGLLWILVGSILLVIAIITFITLHKITIRIDERTLSYAFNPYFFRPRVLKKGDVREIWVRKYKPIREYGGWGYRLGIMKGRAFTINGFWGLQIVFSNGKKLLIGTRQPEELTKAIEQLKRNWELKDG
jgi:hypothetical protein